MTPLLLLDVDGVLDALGDGLRTSVWTRWQLKQRDLHAIGTQPMTGLTPDDLDSINPLLTGEDR